MGFKQKAALSKYRKAQVAALEAFKQSNKHENDEKSGLYYRAYQNRQDAAEIARDFALDAGCSQAQIDLAYEEAVNVMRGRR